jgi:hypothetical protein
VIRVNRTVTGTYISTLSLVTALNRPESEPSWPVASHSRSEVGNSAKVSLVHQPRSEAGLQPFTLRASNGPSPTWTATMSVGVL